MEPGKVPVARQVGETVVLVRDVPAHVCQDCDEYRLEESVVARIKEIVEDALMPKAKVIVTSYEA